MNPLRRLHREIMEDGLLRDLASEGVKGHVNYIYGYPKYTRDEIAADLEYRLYSMTYLGYALLKIIESGKVAPEVKERLTSSYLETVSSYREGGLPRTVYTEWADMEPVGVVEAALLLDDRGRLDWQDYSLLMDITVFGSRSSIPAKKSFLSKLVRRLNRDPEMMRFFSEKERYREERLEILKELVAELGSKKDIDFYGLNGIRKSSRALLHNLRPLLDADFKTSTYGLIASLDCINRREMEEIALKSNVPFLPSRGSRVKVYEDLFDGGMRKGGNLKDFAKFLVRRVEKGEFHYDDAKLKALIHLSEKRGLCDEEFVQMVRGFLGAKLETDTRFFLFKFLYRKTKDRKILEEALRWKSKKIREWTEAQRMKMEK